MDYEAFVRAVERDAQASRDEAERAVRATLQTLAERLTGGEAEDVAESLPPELRPYLSDGSKAEPFHIDEFIRRVAEREAVPSEIAKQHARAVFAALGAALSDKELHDMASELPKDFQELLSAAELAHARAHASGAGFNAATFYERVAERARTDLETARRATEAVLEALGYRISGGEVDDLLGYLPSELHPPLKAGKSNSAGRGQKLSLDEFLGRIAKNESVALPEARLHAQAVLTTLHEAVGEPEFHDVLSELPNDYRALIARS
jgi:uncharacterized protein (DUF2267 family)